jgi:TetR/AcrR family transcriptional regulator
MSPQEVRTQQPAESTRGAILTAAERLFAERGFDNARLEDVAEAVGIKRASIVYYFRDKRALYGAVLSSVFGEYRERLVAALETPGSMLDRLEAAIGAWVDYVAERPTFARLLLREVADSRRDDRPTAAEHIQPFVELVQRFLDVHREEARRETGRIDPAHMAATIAGATVFFVAAMPVLLPGDGFDPLEPEHLDAHRAEVLKIARRLLGVAES